MAVRDGAQSLRSPLTTTSLTHSDGSRDDFEIAATTTSTGTHPVGSQWRKNPVPMCNCDLGYGCSNWEEGTVEEVTGKPGSGMFAPYNKTNFRPGQTSTICPQLPSAVRCLLPMAVAADGFM